MYTVQLVFDADQPDPEDQAVRDYLTEYELEPRYQWDAEDDGRKSQWMQFGGCYLGKHLQGIGQLQRRAVEVELLTDEISRHLNSQSGDVTFSSEDQRQYVISTLVVEFQQESSFQANENGELTAVLDEAEVIEAARSRLTL